MAIFNIGWLGDVDFERIDTSTDGSNITPPRYDVGTILPSSDGGEYMYVKSTGAVTAGDLVKISSDGNFTISKGNATTLPSTEPAACGAAQTAFPTGTSWGWVKIKGPMNVSVLAACVQDVKLYSTATDGAVDDAGTAVIAGLKLITTIVGAAVSPCFANNRLAVYP